MSSPVEPAATASTTRFLESQAKVLIGPSSVPVHSVTSQGSPSPAAWPGAPS